MSVFPDSDCACNLSGDCACGHEERALRNIVNRTWEHGPMTPEQREWCAEETDQAGEGAYDRDDLLSQTDRDLARDTLQAWTDYARSQGML